MKGIVFIVMPEASQMVEVKMPSDITSRQFDVIMNQIKHDFFTKVKPKVDSNSLVVNIYNEKEAEAILSNATSINAVKTLIAAVGDPQSPNWSGRFFTLYGNGDQQVTNALFVLKQNLDDPAKTFLKSHNLSWLCDFLSVPKFQF